MSHMEVACPRCESRQKFATKTRQMAENPTPDSVVELFIHCGKCNWEKLLSRSTSSILKLEKEIRMMEKKYEHRSREGKSVASLHRAIGHKKRALQRMRLHAGLGSE